MWWIILFSSVVAFAADIGSYNGVWAVTRYAWCNGPLMQPGPGACSRVPFGGVDLDRISEFHFEFRDSRQVLAIKDLEKNRWERDLAECTASAEASTGCIAEIRAREDGSYWIRVEEKQEGASSVMTVLLQGENVTVRSPDRALLRFEIKAIQ